MEKTTKTILIAFFLAGFLAGPLLTNAQIGDIPLTKDKVVEILNEVKTWLVRVVSAIAVIMVLVAAFMYITAGGDDSRVTQARKTLTWVVVGVVVAFLSYSVITIIESFLGG